jgi:hypothetical protein
MHLRAIADRVDVWNDSQINAGESWDHEIARAIAAADVAILLVSADYLASRFIAKAELPKLLESARSGRTLIMPVMLSPAWLDPGNPLLNFQFVNSPSRPLTTLKQPEQDKVFVEVARAIQRRLPKLVRSQPPGKPSVDAVTQLTPLVDEIAARVVQLSCNSCRQIRPGNPNYQPRRLPRTPIVT